MMMLVALSNNQNKMIIMKALTNILRATLALCTALSLTSCLDDDEIKSSIITGINKFKSSTIKKFNFTYSKK